MFPSVEGKENTKATPEPAPKPAPEPASKTARAVNLATNTAQIVKGASAGATAGGAGGALAGAGKEAAKILAKNPKAREKAGKAATGLTTALIVLSLIVVMAVLGMGGANLLNNSASTQANLIRQRAGDAALASGVNPQAVSYISSIADGLGIAWEIPVSAYLNQQQAAAGGVGPWRIADDQAGQVPAPAGDCPVTEASGPPGAAVTHPGAEDFCAATNWVMVNMVRVFGEEPTLNRQFGLGDGATVTADDKVEWQDEALFRERIVTPYAKALARMPLAGASEMWGTGVIEQAVNWHLGLESPCSMLGANYSFGGVADGAWTHPTIDRDGVISGNGAFGMRFHPILKYYRMHKGVDIGNKSGTPIWAVAAGTVTQAGYLNGGAGYSVKIDHGGGIVSVYFHLLAGSITVAAGQTVSPGHQIASMGSTGLSTAPHLHFEIRVNGTHVDPLQFMLERGIDLRKPPGAPSSSALSAPAPGTPAPGGSMFAPSTDGTWSLLPPSTPPAAPLSSTTEAAPAGGSEPPPPATSTSNPTNLTSKTTTGVTIRLNQTQIDNAAFIMGVGQKLGADQRVIKSALMAALVESRIRHVASKAVPESMNYPNDGVIPGDHDSVGLFQQRALQGTWGTVAQIMDKDYTTRMYYGGPTKPHPTGPPGVLDVLAKHPTLIDTLGPLVQKVQVSAYPNRYAEFEPVATDIMAAVAGVLVPGGAAFCNPSGGAMAAGAGTYYDGDFPQSNRLDHGGLSFTRLSDTAKVGYRAVAALFPEITGIGGWRASSAIKTSDHVTIPANAIDVMIKNYKDPAQIALGDKVADFFITNHKELNVKYVIWRQRTWTPKSGAWRPMADRGGDTANHMDHPHVSFHG